MFLCESKSTLFGLPKVDAFRNYYDYLQQNSNAQYLKNNVFVEH